MGLFLRLAVTQRERMSKTMKRKGRRRGRDMRKKHDCEIHPDLVTEILIRLPSKSLMKFKCVSKDWSSLISCRYFSHLFTVRRLRKPRLYMCLVAKDNQRVLLSSTSPDNNSFVVVDKDLSIPRMGYSANIVRGLMCFRVKKKACIYNPSTKQLLTLPAIKSDIITEQDQKKQIQYYIGHDPVSDRYKVVCTIMVSSAYLCNLKSEHWVFQLDKAGGLWNKVFPLENYHPHALATVGRCMNGVLYYLAWIDMYNCAVFSFDTMSEELTTILVPEKVADVLSPAALMKADLIEYGGKLAIFNYTYLREVGLVDLWVLIDAGKKKWSTKSLVLQPCQRHLVQDIELMIVKGTTQDGKVILAPVEMRSRFYILCYDIQSNDLRKVEIKGVPEPWFDKECYFDLKFMDVSESLIDGAEIQNSRTNLFLVGKT